MSVLLSPCGFDCFGCDKFENGCGGCFKISGKVWWTEFVDNSVCGIFDCCVNNNHFENCGCCFKFPCGLFFEKDPTRTDEENKEILEKQINALRKN